MCEQINLAGAEDLGLQRERRDEEMNSECCNDSVPVQISASKALPVAAVLIETRMTRGCCSQNGTSEHPHMEKPMGRCDCCCGSGNTAAVARWQHSSRGTLATQWPWHVGNTAAVARWLPWLQLTHKAATPPRASQKCTG